jgi:hypothetical protein
VSSSVASPHAHPQAHDVVARWNDIMNSSARAIDALFKKGMPIRREVLGPDYVGSPDDLFKTAR